MEGNLKRNPLIFKCQLFLFSPLVIQIEKYFFNELHTKKKFLPLNLLQRRSNEHWAFPRERKRKFFCCYVICLFCTLCFLLPQHVIFLPLPSNAIRWYHSTHVDLKAFTFSFFLTFCRDNIHRHRQLCLHFNIKCSLKACCLAFDACPHFFLLHLQHLPHAFHSLFTNHVLDSCLHIFRHIWMVFSWIWVGCECVCVKFKFLQCIGINSIIWAVRN